MCKAVLLATKEEVHIQRMKHVILEKLQTWSYDASLSPMTQWPNGQRPLTA